MKTQIDWSKFAGSIIKLPTGKVRNELRLNKVTAAPYRPKTEAAKLNAIAHAGREKVK